jgi:hypothetical protein
MLRHFVSAGTHLLAYFADIIATVNLKLVINPVVAADVQLPTVLAVFECADIGTEIAKYMTPDNYLVRTIALLQR